MRYDCVLNSPCKAQLATEDVFEEQHYRYPFLGNVSDTESVDVSFPLFRI